VVWAHAIPWGVPVTITPRRGQPFMEWFARASLQPPAWPQRAAFSVGHSREGGTRVGSIVRLVNGRLWLDAAALIDDSEAGHAFLDGLGGDGGNLPVSIAFKPLDGGTVRYPRDPLTGLEGLQRTRATLVEVAVVENSAYEGARLFARSDLSALAAMEAAAS
jgi:hypothetical protein